MINFFSSEFYNFHLVCIAFFGLSFGSFLNVCIYRIPAGLSIVSPGSHCFSCGTPIRWYDNIPLFSYLVLRGRCRWCGSGFSPRYFFIELLTGFLFALTFYRFGYTFATPVYIVFICLLIVGCFTDIDHWIIPDGVTLGGAVFGLAAAILAGFFPRGFHLWGAWPLFGKEFYAPFLNAIVGALFGAGFIYLIGILGTIIFRKDAMGIGDVKLFLLIGSVLGAINSVYVLMIGSLIGSVFGGFLILHQKFIKKRTQPTSEKPKIGDFLQEDTKGEVEEEVLEDKETRVLKKILQPEDEKQARGEMSGSPGVHHIPFGPYLSVAAVIVTLWGEQIKQTLLKWMLWG